MSDVAQVRAEFALRRAIAEVPGGPVVLGVAVYRGIGLRGVEALAEPLGWRVDWTRSRFEAGRGVCLVPRSTVTDPTVPTASTTPTAPTARPAE